MAACDEAFRCRALSWLEELIDDALIQFFAFYRRAMKKSTAQSPATKIGLVPLAGR
jgi:hypothetical protein